ncbi:NUDIX hydrolase [Pararhodonellum marinum]|uniref:NUDIX hydrolase n=1 Tax=Pararhodonellum marinum TaxID=2755358 RepID=UPI00188FD154|nr:NUDIX domain-containing protein [Pararhodonellum marinum]
MIVSVDCAIFGFERELSIFLIKRTNPYFKNKWSLPGSIVFEDESLEDAAERTLYELSGLKNIYLDQVGAFGDPKRTKGARILTVSFMAIIDKSKYNLEPKVKNRTFISQTNEEELILSGKWFKLNEMPLLPQDHSEIAHTALKFLRQKFRYSPICFELLPEKFTLKELQDLYQAVYEVQLDPSNFRKKILKSNWLVELDEYSQQGSSRKARLYAFNMVLQEQGDEQEFVFDF